MKKDLYSKWIEVADKATENYNSLTKEERIWFNIQVLIDSINNGGLISYYYNSGAEYVYDLLVDLKIIKINSVADIIDRYNLILFPKTLVPEDMNARNEVIAQLDEKSNDLIQKLEDEVLLHLPEVEAHLEKFLEVSF